MQIDRIDLADLHQPTVIANAIHRQLGRIAPPVPVVDIALALGIVEVRTDLFDGFEGMLLTNRVRSFGAILANTRHGRRRTRFTIAHELGHFLMERHELSDDQGFSCQAQDMTETGVARRHMRQEAQANQFAIGLLAPPHLFDPILSDDPNLRDAQRARDLLDISLEASVRRMVDRRPERLAAVWTKDGQVRYVHRPNGFPWIHWGPKDFISKATQAYRAITNGTRGFTEFSEAHSLIWTDRPDLDLQEQTRVGRDGHAVTLLHVVSPEEDWDSEGDQAVLSSPGFR